VSHQFDGPVALDRIKDVNVAIADERSVAVRFQYLDVDAKPPRLRQMLGTFFFEPSKTTYLIDSLNGVVLDLREASVPELFGSSTFRAKHFARALAPRIQAHLMARLALSGEPIGQPIKFQAGG
jgi:hypothetical protein